MLAAVPPQLPTPSAMMFVHPPSHLCPLRCHRNFPHHLPAVSAAQCRPARHPPAPRLDVERPRRQPRLLTPGHTIRRRPARQPPKSDPAQSRLPVVWQPFGESQPSQQSAEQPNAGLATAPISGFALSAPPSEVLALVPHGALPQPSTPLAVVPDGALPQPSTPPSATAGPGPDTPSQPMAPPPAAGLPV